MYSQKPPLRDKRKKNWTEKREENSRSRNGLVLLHSHHGNGGIQVHRHLDEFPTGNTRESKRVCRRTKRRAGRFVTFAPPCPILFIADSSFALFALVIAQSIPPTAPSNDVIFCRVCAKPQDQLHEIFSLKLLTLSLSRHEQSSITRGYMPLMAS